jgi:hypothetical protein
MADLSPPRSCSSGVARPTRCSAAFPLAALTVTAVAVLDPPLALTPMYYVWPLMTAAYSSAARDPHHLRRRVRSFGAGALWALGEEPLLIEWITVAIVGGVVVAFVDAPKRGLGELVDRLHVLAREEPLTGALNRRAFVEQVDHEIARAGRGGHSCGGGDRRVRSPHRAQTRRSTRRAGCLPARAPSATAG